uniref:Putative secreted protein n=1 Tax=Ixodes ricinus TaxID=34613 RepID=V5H2V0_IXORI
MKAVITVLCFLVAQSCVIAMLSEEECRRPFPTPMCADGSVKTIFSFCNATDRCESYTGCGSGTNIFDTYEDCVGQCPYGNHHATRGTH